MPGVKLRSEKIEKFDALGERGQPVYKVAPQILAVLKRWENQYPDIARHFAVPQASADGGLIDWYAPHDGDVIPWEAASDDERRQAHTQLVAVQQSVAHIQAHTQSATHGQSGDGALFGKLLAWVIHHPDASYLYLVDQRPVITFWGFLNNGADRTLDPLHALRPVTPPPVAPIAIPVPPAENTISAPMTPAAPLPPVAEQRTRWWRRWWFWLGLALALGALLLGLRACMPKALPFVDGVTNSSDGTPTPITVNPGIGSASLRGDISDLSPLPGKSSQVDLPAGIAVQRTQGEMPASGMDSLIGNSPSPADASLNTPTPQAPALAATDPALLPSNGAATSLQQPDLSAPAGLPAASPPTASSVDTKPPAVDLPGRPLTIPDNAKEGRADFLNGNWSAGAGIQDRNTGAPLRLQYAFEKGQGEVKLSRHDGVQCSAPVTARMQGGKMSIANTSQATCTDKSVYALPDVMCTPNTQRAADCVGRYGDSRFPMTMRQTNP